MNTEAAKNEDFAMEDRELVNTEELNEIEEDEDIEAFEDNDDREDNEETNDEQDAQHAKLKYLHIFGPDTKNSYGIMSQLYLHLDLTRHRFLIMGSRKNMARFPKLKEFRGLQFIPDVNPIKKIIHFYKKLTEADVIVWHSLFFPRQQYAYFLALFRHFLKKSIWIEWGADLYLWKYSNQNFKGMLRNFVHRRIREKMRVVGCCFAVDDQEVHAQFGDDVKCFYTPLANPKKDPTGLIDEVEAGKPNMEGKEKPFYNVQIAHNSFSFNNHVRLIELMKKFDREDMRFILPLNYGIYGINGQFGGVSYRNTVIKYAENAFKNAKVSVIKKAIDFNRYLGVLWNMDIVVFDFDRPCGLGTLRILLLMGKKIYLPAGSPYYNFLVSKGLPIFDTNKIPEMTFEEFVEPPVYTTKEWVYSYMNNDHVIQYWLDMFEEIEKNKEAYFQ